MVPNGWKITSLGDICDGNLQTGPFGSQLHAHEYVDSGVSVLMPKDLIGFRSNLLEAAKITETKAQELKKHVLKSGDLLFSRRGDVTRFALIDKQAEGAICGTGCLKARPNQNHSPEFLAYFLQKDSVKKWLEQNAVGQTMPNMNTEILRELPLMSASSKYEEEKIAQILSTWDKAIAVTEQLLANSQQQKKALMQQLLTGKKRLLDENGARFEGEWEEFSLGNIAKVYQPKTISQSQLSFDGYPVYGANGIIGYYCDFNHELEQIAVTCRGSTCGVVNWTMPKSWITGNAMVINVDNNSAISKKFLFYVLSNADLKYLITGSGQPQITGDIKNHVVHLASFKEQKVIAQVLTIADQEIEVLQRKLDCLQQEKKALMQQLLTGKRRVKVAA